MRRIRIAADRWNFELEETGEFVTPLGGNILDDQHPAVGTLFQKFDEEDCNRRFGTMAELGLNCLRQAIGVNEVFDPKAGLKCEGLKNWDTFIGLAEKHGVYLMPVGGYVGGNDWFDVERLADSGPALEESCAFWEAFVGHYAGHPAVWAWDLRNELLYSSKPHMVTPDSRADEAHIDALIKKDWPDYLRVRYQSLDAMNRVYRSRFASFAEVPCSLEFVEKPFDPCIYDFRNYLNERGYAWCKSQCEVIRSVSPLHLIVQGNNTWLSPDQDLFLAHGFHNRSNHDLFDFVTHHPYPAWQATPEGRGDPLDGGAPLQYWLNACIGMSRLDFYGKPVVLQEFGWYGGGTSRFLCELPYRTEKEHADYSWALMQALIPHVNGFINWPTFDMPSTNDTSNHGGIFTQNGKPKELTAVYGNLVKLLQGKRLQRAAGTRTLSLSLLGLFTCRAYQDQMWDQVNETIANGEIPDFRFIA
jgi:hypothetical protein